MTLNWQQEGFTCIITKSNLGYRGRELYAWGIKKGDTVIKWGHEDTQEDADKKIRQQIALMNNLDSIQYL